VNLQEIQPRQDPPRVLLIEDDPAIALLVKDLLHKSCRLEHSQTVIGARATLKDAINIYQPPQILLVDFNLPDGDGRSLIRDLRNPQTRLYLESAWILAFTVEISLETVQNTLRDGANDFLAKPFTPEGLMIKFEVARFGAARLRTLQRRNNLLTTELQRLQKSS
jgi:DNA-binding response OmpR family regulator